VESCTIPLTEAKLAMSQEYINLLWSKCILRSK